MTLYKQLLLSALLVLLCLCAGLWMGELTRTRDFLINQMEVHAQDTATSLGLSLTTLTDGNNVPAMETMISALFDRGFYRLIELRDVDGKLLVERRADAAEDLAPAWFMRIVPLDAPQAAALVQHGWRQTGTLTVECHTGFAYLALWQAVQTTALWFSLTAAAIAALGGIGLRILLKPLHQVEEQALALCNRQFNIQEQLPRTRELRLVVSAMNHLTVRLRELFQEQAAIAENLLQRTYQDPLTSIGNRRYLEAQITALHAAKHGVVKGAFLLFQLQELQAINQAGGYQEGDRILLEIAAILKQGCRDLPQALLGRLAGGDFALLLPNVDEHTTQQIANGVLTDLHMDAAMGAARAHEARVCCGGVLYEQATPFTQLLARADTALNTARHRQANTVALLPLTDGEPTMCAGKTQWMELLRDTVANRAIVLYSQPTVSRRDPGTIIHHEIFARVRAHDGRELSLGMFVPLAERSGLMPALDRMIIELLLEQALEQFAPHRIAINLSPISLADAEFSSWLDQQLTLCARKDLRLNFEFPEFRVLRHSKMIKAFAERIQRHGHRLGIDHFGQGLTHFGYLKSLLPDYVKIDRAITAENLDEQSDSCFFINTLCNVAHSLDIKVIIEAVETESQWQGLAALHVDAVQGFYIQEPQPVSMHKK